MAESAAKFNRRQRERKNRAAKKEEERQAPAKQEAAERSQRRTTREQTSARRSARLESREVRNQKREERQRITKPIGRAISKTTEGTGSSTALGLGVAGVAALFVTAGIQGKKLGEVLEGETGKAGESPTPSTPTPSEEAVPGSFTSGTTTKPEVEQPPEHLPPNPFTIGPSLNKKQELAREASELRVKISPLLKLAESLEKEWKRYKISEKEAQKIFGQKYPHYVRWTDELAAIIDTQEKEGFIKKGSVKG